ncbi:hypothetical protein AVEN_267679-1 [Araneus ventricosus]|uniref:Uncharacterized protein n=1 Tax=Araneus ventricosus TaxID=182803 RepID=A0A4Y2N1T1_ARAVE|nr:hypothetical protein AVEN_267679-1 [Araneus ventricosus]
MCVVINDTERWPTSQHQASDTNFLTSNKLPENIKAGYKMRPSCWTYIPNPPAHANVFWTQLKILLADTGLAPVVQKSDMRKHRLHPNRKVCQL